MKNIVWIIAVVLIATGYAGCKKRDTEFRELLAGREIVYPGLPAAASYRPGDNRLMLLWNPSPDPTIKKYVIYWNNVTDSLVVNANSSNPADTVKTIIPNLLEYVYSFTIYSYDAAGNRSIPLVINNARVFGSLYNSTLLNRGYDANNPYQVNTDGSVVLNFITPDTINTATAIRYTNNAGTFTDKLLAPGDNSIVLPDYKPGTDVLYRSSYIPVRNAIDTFTVASFDTFPKIFSYVEADKSLFQEHKLSNDVNNYESGTSVSKLWDGSVGPQGYPNIFHSDGSYMPHVLTFDMGKTYNSLGRIEETGRDCCNNPTKFEVWGINDISNAETSLRADDGGWPAEAVAKGWVLLTTVTRGDNGNAPLKVDVDNPPPVRYIRIRVINTATGSNYSNMSELTFWNKE